MFGSDRKRSWYSDHQGRDRTSLDISLLSIPVRGIDIIPSYWSTREQCSQYLRSRRDTYLKYRSQWTGKCENRPEFRWEKTEKHVLYLILLRKMTNKRGQSDRIRLWMLYRRQIMVVHCSYFSTYNRKFSRKLKAEKFETGQMWFLSDTQQSCEFHCMRYCQCNLFIKTREASGILLVPMYIFYFITLHVNRMQTLFFFFVRDIKGEAEL